MKEEIIKLTKLWYLLVGLDHHKDRDCHWIINTTYSYGEPPIFEIEHNGYVYEEISRSFDSYEDAESGLIEELKMAIEKEKEWAERVIKEPEKWDKDQVENAHTILNEISNSGLLT